ncbi:MAG: type II toxin-antitoxin system VapC family toxin [Rhodothermales bacterium]
MRAIDTNLLVRLIARDDAEQLAAARRVMEAGPCFIPDTVFLETAWVLRSRYGASREQIYAELITVLGLPNTRVADPDRIRDALEWFEEGLDVGDAFHLAASQHADAFVTFDREMIARSEGMGRCPVEQLK